MHQNGCKLCPFLISADTVGVVVLHPSIGGRYAVVTPSVSVVSCDIPTVLSAFLVRGVVSDKTASSAATDESHEKPADHQYTVSIDDVISELIPAY